MRILSIRSPWWWFILHAGKDIENRNWRHAPSYRGPLLIHASNTYIKRDVADDVLAAMQMYNQRTVRPAPPDLRADHLLAGRGHIVGICDLTAVVRGSNSPWFVGPMGLVLANARPIAPIYFKAALGLLEVPPEIRELVEREQAQKS